jgi:flagellar hook-associated protein 2
MATVGSTGIDVNGIVGQLMTLERRPLTALTQREAQVTSRIAAFARVQGAVASLQTASAGLAGASTWTGKRASVSGDGVTAAVTSAALATPGTYAIKVNQLATSQALASTSFAASSSLVGSGTLTITRGTTVGNSFTAGAAPAVTVTAEATDSLATLRDKLNAAFAADGSGLSASIISDGGGVRLTLLGKDTGAASTFRIGVTDTGDGVDTDDAGLSRLAFDPSVALTPPATTAPGRNLVQTRAGADAQIEVNGLVVSAASNKVSGIIEGVTLDLKKAAPDQVNQLAIERDTGTMRGAVDAFVKAYNDLDKLVRDLTAFDPASRRGAVLNGDSALRSLQNQLRGLVRAQMSAAGGDLVSLSEAGIEIGRDGTMSVNATRFDAAAVNPDRLSRLFTTVSDTDSARGFGVRIRNLADGLVSGDGLLPARTKALQSQIDAINQQEDRLNLRLTLIEARLRKQYVALDTQLQRLQGTSDSLANALRQLPGANTGNGG